MKMRVEYFPKSNVTAGGVGACSVGVKKESTRIGGRCKSGGNCAIGLLLSKNKMIKSGEITAELGRLCDLFCYNLHGCDKGIGKSV